MTHAKEVVIDYQRAIGSGDWKSARALLEDHLEFRGPLDSFGRAEEYIGALQRAYPMIDDVDVKRTFAEGNDVVVLCDLRFKPPLPTMYVVEWYQVRGDKISRIQVVFDPRPMAQPQPK